MKRPLAYALPADRYYDQASHVWVDLVAPATARCGLDPLGSETSGDVVAISFAPVGTEVARREAFGSLEAAKFVGPLEAPVSGIIRAHNEAALRNPGLLNRDPMAAWLIEIELSDLRELALLLHGEERVRAWLERETERFRQRGMVAQ